MRKISENILVHETPFKLFGAEFGNRMTIIRLSSGELLLHSPIKIEPGLSEEIRSLGEVSHIVTPNKFHGLFVDEWLSEFPEARYYSANVEGNGDVAIQLGEDTFGEEIAVIKIDGVPKLNEYALFHKGSNTLVLTDIAFNIGSDVSLWTKIFFKINGAFNSFGPTRLMKSMVSDWGDLKTSISNILEYEIDRIIVSHGEVVESDAKNKLRKAFIECSEVISSQNSNSRLSLSRCG